MYLNIHGDTLRLLEFRKILDRIASFTSTDYGMRLIRESKPLEEPEDRLERSRQMRNLLYAHGDIPLGGIHDITGFIEKIERSYVLEGKELKKISRTLDSLSSLKEFLNKVSEEYPSVWDIAKGFYEMKSLVKKIDRCIGEEGEVLDKASPDLKKIRGNLKKLTHSLRQKMDNILSKYKESLSENLVLTREGRYVIPLQASKKNMYEGILHGASSTGMTVYFEPKELVSLNNELRLLRSQEREEVNRILRKLTEVFKENLHGIEQNIELFSEIDFMYASARYSMKKNASFIFPGEKTSLSLREARHPLINEDDVVPINFELPEKINSVVITGPNTGGKTVALKTVGLAVLLSLSGLPVLARSDSKIKKFNKLFADIGDEQSIEQSLSTFSSHMGRIVRIVKEADEHSLVLLDELGAGTDPIEGSGLSMAIIDSLIDIGAKSVVTTHLSPIKLHAIEREDIMNASVEFDVRTLKPTYHLIMGVPGSSNAIKISKRLGLSEEILEKAEKYLATEAMDFEAAIGKLNEEKSRVEQIKRDAEGEKKELSSLKNKFEEKLDALKNKRYKEVSEELSDLEERVDGLLKEVENAINLSRSEKEEDKIKAVKLLQDVKKKIKEVPIKPEIKDNGNEKIKVGDTVKDRDTGLTGEVTSIEGENFVIKAGKITVKLAPENLMKLSGKNEKKEISREDSYINTSKTSTTNEIDIRGSVVDDIPFLLDDFIKGLKTGNHKKGYIIHGKGTGRLASAVWDYVRNQNKIKSFRIGTPREGGHGVTVIEV
ncbi:MAG: endonuclease MutS2 [Thermotogota bacterium]|nr:endonuclease MutS2 [Thermotogota bacterium]